MKASNVTESMDSKTESMDSRRKLIEGSLGCDLIAGLAKHRSFKDIAAPASMSDNTIKTYAYRRRSPSFDQLAELMVYHDSLLEGFLDHIKTRRAECQKT